LLTVRWYFQYRLCYRDLVEIMSECGISIANITIMESTEKGCVFYHPRYDISPFPNKWVKKVWN
jgi:transposase-like protein